MVAGESTTRLAEVLVTTPQEPVTRHAYVPASSVATLVSVRVAVIAPLTVVPLGLTPLLRSMPFRLQR
jgi:hypothetical protein